jgi:hypothetical protein
MDSIYAVIAHNARAAFVAFATKIPQPKYFT